MRRSTCSAVIGCTLEYWLRLRISARRPLRGRWSDGQLAVLFSMAFLFAARGMFGSQSNNASNVSPMRSGVLMSLPGQATSTCLARYHPASSHDMPRCSSFAVSWCVVLRMQLSSITALTVISEWTNTNSQALRTARSFIHSLTSLFRPAYTNNSS